MNNVPAEIIKQYRVKVEGVNFTVYGRIIKSVSGDDENVFLGELSHYCKQTEDAIDVYRPSLVGNNIDRVEHLITNYLEKFTNINIEENKYY
ncbi:MAG TPA: hypothetical protein PK649_02455 [Vicingus sp.]|nr:hypothetical protein [Vicingus sp.]